MLNQLTSLHIKSIEKKEKKMKYFVLVFLVTLTYFHTINAAAACNCRVPALPRILNGKESRTSVPWQVLIRTNPMYDEQVVCTGVLIQESWVMTAASCIHNEMSARLQIVSGTNNITNASMADVRTVLSLRMHPDFNPYNVENGSDIALIKLSSPLKLQKRKIELACLGLDFNETTTEKVVMASGFGVVNETTLEYSNSSRYAFFNQTTSSPHNRTISAKAVVKNVTVCDGDTGGPLHLTENSGKTKVIGITSYNGGTIDEDSGDIVYCTDQAFFTKLSSVKSFIETNVEQHC